MEQQSTNFSLANFPVFWPFNIPRSYTGGLYCDVVGLSMIRTPHWAVLLPLELKGSMCLPAHMKRHAFGTIAYNLINYDLHLIIAIKTNPSKGVASLSTIAFNL